MPTPIERIQQAYKTAYEQVSVAIVDARASRSFQPFPQFAETVSARVPGGRAFEMQDLRRQGYISNEAVRLYDEVESAHNYGARLVGAQPSETETTAFEELVARFIAELRKPQDGERLIERIYGKEGVERLRAISDPQAHFLTVSLNQLFDMRIYPSPDHAARAVLGDANYGKMTQVELIAEVKRAALWPDLRPSERNAGSHSGE